MRKYTFLYIFVFLLLAFTRSNALEIGTVSDNCTCSNGAFSKVSVEDLGTSNPRTIVYAVYNTGTAYTPPSPQSSCGIPYSWDWTYYDGGANSTYPDKTNVIRAETYYECSVCVAPQINDPLTGLCVDPAPTCPEGEHNTQTDSELDPICVCDNNLPKYLNDNGDMVCQVAQCPIDYNGKALRQQNQSYTDCHTMYPSSLYETEYITDIGISCCFATGKNTDSNSTPPTCPDGTKLNDVGECVEDIPAPDPSDCPIGQEWDNFSQSCITSPDPSSPDDGQGGSSSGGTDYNDTSNPYAGGANGAGGEGTENVVLEYSSDETNDILESYGSKSTSVFNEYLNSLTPDLTSLYKISIPTMPDCGCSDIDYSMSLLGHSYTGKAEICSPLETLLGFLRPLLWFFFLIGMLFSYFRGGE